MLGNDASIRQQSAGDAASAKTAQTTPANNSIPTWLKGYEASLREAAQVVDDSPQAKARGESLIAVFNAMEAGRITDENAQAALAYHREHGTLDGFAAELFTR